MRRGETSERKGAEKTARKRQQNPTASLNNSHSALTVPLRSFSVKQAASDWVAITEVPPRNCPLHRGRSAPLRSISEKKKALREREEIKGDFQSNIALIIERGISATLAPVRTGLN